jgi:hypothetical protein
MKRTIVAAAALATLAFATTPRHAHAGSSWHAGAIIGGVAAGVVLGSVLGHHHHHDHCGCHEHHHPHHYHASYYYVPRPWVYHGHPWRHGWYDGHAHKFSGHGASGRYSRHSRW